MTREQDQPYEEAGLVDHEGDEEGTSSESPFADHDPRISEELDERVADDRDPAHT